MLNTKVVVAGMVAVLFAGASQAKATPVVYGLGFSPYMQGQSPPQQVPIGQIRERLGIVAPYARWIRTWGSASGLENIPAVAKDYGLNVAQCVFVNGDPANDELQKANLVAAAAAGYVDAAIVGSESLVNGWLTDAQLVAHLRDVRRRLDEAGLASIPVCTAEPYGQWANAQPGGLFHRDASGRLVHAAVLQEVDQLLVHAYPFHEGVPIEQASLKLAEMYGEVIAAVQAVRPGLPVLIGETGWPSAGNRNGQAAPSIQNMETYFRQVTRWSAEKNVPLFWFSSFDETWKPPGYAGVEQHWGLHYEDGQAKFPIPEPGAAPLLLSGLVWVFRQAMRLRARGA